jgi:hypothetical protein
MSEQKLETLWDRAMSAKTQDKRDYWLDRYDHEKGKVYRPKLSKIRPINDILNERKTKCS